MKICDFGASGGTLVKFIQFFCCHVLMHPQVYNAPERFGSDTKDKPLDIYSFGM